MESELSYAQQSFCDCVVLVPTHNRHANLDVSTQYFAQTGIPVLYVDSTREKYKNAENLCRNIKYFHRPGLEFAQKMLSISNEIDAFDYVVQCADDDFVLFSGVEMARGFLRKNPSFVSVRGRSLCFIKELPGRFFDTFNNNVVRKVEASTSRERVQGYFYDYADIFYAMYPSQKLKKIYSLMAEVEFSNYQWYELFFGTVMAAEGKMAFLDFLWNVREFLWKPSWSYGEKLKRVIPWENMEDPLIQQDFFRAKELIFREYGEDLFSNMLDSFLRCNARYHQRSLVKKMLGKKLLPYAKLLKYSMLSKKHSVFGVDVLPVVRALWG